MLPLRFQPRFLAAAAAGVAAFGGGCGGTGPNGNLLPPSEACATQPVTQLEPGQHQILDPSATNGCLRVPPADAGGAKYLLVLTSTNGTRSSSGIHGTYLLRASQPSTSAAGQAPGADLGGLTAGQGLRVRDPSLRGRVGASFDRTLRALEREALADPETRRPASRPGNVILAPPPLGDVRTFKACSNLECSSFTNVTATARYVGMHAAIYLDNNAPASDPFTTADLAELGTSFDTYHYPIDTTAFGRESDIDANGLVIVLATKAVNDLTPDCESGRVVGFFYGVDLLNRTNSNRAEIFYTLVPAPQTSGCSAVGRRTALNNLKPTLIHEFQHMISFNQHALVRPGSSEDTWLNEALSSHAEELGGRLIPDGECIASGLPSCRSQYSSGNITNGYNYLEDTDTSFVFFAHSEPGTLSDRGAGWLFLRWMLDQFSADSILGTSKTRALVGTSLTGMANLTAVTGSPLSSMIPQWLMATYLDDGVELPEEATGRLRFKSWGLREIWSNPEFFTAGFPLDPPSITSSFTRSGPLNAGSGQHFTILQQTLGRAIDIQVLRNTGGGQLDPSLQARFGLVRIR